MRQAMPKNGTCRYARLRISLRERVLDYSRQDETNDRKLIEDARVRFYNGIGTFGAMVLVLFIAWY
jgi:hypothetical protein